MRRQGEEATTHDQRQRRQEGTSTRRSDAVTHKPLRAVLFDWGDTLIRPPGITTDNAGHLARVEAFFHDSLQPALQRTGRATASSWPAFREVYEEAAMAQVRSTLDTGREHSLATRIERALDGSNAGLDAADYQALGEALGHSIARGCTPMPGARALLERLHGRIRVGLLSNYPHAATVRDSLDDASLLQYLDVVVISAETGWSKPHRPAFEAAIDALGTDPETVLFVGDDLDNDMRGAKSMAMRTAWLPRADERGHDAAAHDFVDHRLDRLDDLDPILAPALAGQTSRDPQQ